MIIDVFGDATAFCNDDDIFCIIKLQPSHPNEERWKVRVVICRDGCEYSITGIFTNEEGATEAVDRISLLAQSAHNPPPSNDHP